MESTNKGETHTLSSLSQEKGEERRKKGEERRKKREEQRGQEVK